MFKKILLASFVFVLSFSFIKTFAQELPSCFDFYTFQSVQVSVGSEKGLYNAGEKVTFSGELINQNTYPVVDGYVFVRISESNPKYVTEGNLAIDEFIALGPVALDAGEKKPVSFEYNLPKNIKAGSYRADYFFSVGKQYNLGGLPFTNEIVVGFDDFRVNSKITSNVFLDRSATKVNKSNYQQIGNWPVVASGTAVTVSQGIKNVTGNDEVVTVSYDLYFWDSLNTTDLISSNKETVTVLKGKTSTVTYSIPKVEKSVYLLKITAETLDGNKSILNVRIASDIPTPRINYFALTDFPIKLGDQVKVFSCFHSTSNVDSEGKVVVIAKDRAGVELAKLEYKDLITSAVSAQVQDLIATKDLTYVKLDQTLYDEDNNLVSEKSLVYDCTTLGSKRCEDMTKNNYALYLAIVAAIFLLVSIALLRRKRNLSLVLLAIAVVLTLSGFILTQSKTVFAETVSPDGKTKTETKSRNYKWIKGNLSDGRIAANGTISLTHAVTLSGNTLLSPGEQISFSRSSDCTFNLNGGSWDTPYCGSAIAFVDSTSRNGSLLLQHTALGMSLTSSNSNILSCSGNTCTAGNSYGTVVVTAAVPASTITASAGSYVNIKLNDSATENGSVCPNGTHNAVACGGSVINANHKMNLFAGNNDSPVVVDSYSPTWSVEVRAPQVCQCGGTYPSCDSCDPPETCPCGGTYPSCNTCPPPGGSCSCGGIYPSCNTCPPPGGSCSCGGIYPECLDCEPDVIRAECNMQNARTYESGEEEWESSSFCVAPGVLRDWELDFPDYGEDVYWSCDLWKDMEIIDGSTSICYAYREAITVLSPADCSIVQDNGPDELGTIYVNKVTKLLTQVTDYDSFQWFEVSNTGTRRSLGTSANATTIFTSVGNKNIKLQVTKDDEISECDANVRVIPKPTTVIEQ